MFENNLKFTRAACWINSEITNGDNSITLVIFFCCHYCYQLLCCSYWRSLMLSNSISWSCIKSTVQIHLALHPCDTFFINTLSTDANSVEKICNVVMNVNLQLKIRFKKFYWLLKVLYFTLALSSATNIACFIWNFYIS